MIDEIPHVKETTDHRAIQVAALFSIDILSGWSARATAAIARFDGLASGASFVSGGDMLDAAGSN